MTSRSAVCRSNSSHSADPPPHRRGGGLLQRVLAISFRHMSDVEGATQPNLRDLACEIGQVQVYWCFLENEMQRLLDEGGSAQTLDKGLIVSRWKRLMKTVRGSDQTKIKSLIEAVETVARMRNLLAHGIKVVNANPWEENTAYVICREQNGTEHKLTIDMIKNLSCDIERITLSLRRVERDIHDA